MSNMPFQMLVLCLAWSTIVRADPPTDNPVIAWRDFSQLLQSARPGDRLQTPFRDTTPFKDVPLTIADAPGGPRLLFSDKPEYFRTGDGISMQETIEPGVHRLYLYHVPEPSSAKKIISAVIENLGDAPLTLTFTRYASPKPSGDYHKVARQAMRAFLESEPAPGHLKTRTLAPGKRMVIDPAIDQTLVTKDLLVHVFHEFSIDQPARVTVFQRDPAADGLQVIDTLPELPRVLEGFHASGAGRGLFQTSERAVMTKDNQPIDTSFGTQVLTIADGKLDPWIEGRDSLDSSTPIQNKGNYGVMYRVQIPYTSSDGKRLAVLMAGHRPDNQWCKFTAAVVDINAGHHPGGVIDLPTEAPRFDSLPQAVVMQTYPPVPEGQPGTIEFTYSPPGACCLPTPILLIPY